MINIESQLLIKVLEEGRSSSTYAAALAYRGLFPFVLILAVLTLLFGVYALVDGGSYSCLLSEAPSEARDCSFHNPL